MKKQGKRVQVDLVYIAAKFELVKVRRTVASGMETAFTGMEEFATKAPFF
jgi:hypothetical protein